MLFQPLKKNCLDTSFYLFAATFLQPIWGLTRWRAGVSIQSRSRQPTRRRWLVRLICQPRRLPHVSILPTPEVAFWNCTNLNFQTNNSEENFVFYLRLNLKLIEANLCQRKVDHLDTVPKLQFQVSPMTPIRMSRICNTRTGERLSTTRQAHRGLFKH